MPFEHEYWKRRNIAALKLEKSKNLNGLGPSTRIENALHPLDAKLTRFVDGLTVAFGDLKNKLMEWREENKNESKSG